MPTIKPAVLVSAISEIFLALRVPADAARVVAEHLVDADVCGVASHGIIRVPQYVEAVEAGRVVADARLVIEHETVSAVRLDGGNGFGQVMACGPMEIAVERAGRTGAAVVTLHNCGHTGRIGAYTEQKHKGGSTKVSGAISKVVPDTFISPKEQDDAFDDSKASLSLFRSPLLLAPCPCHTG